ncbi:MAG: BatD family protein [Candidatus Korarchaeota archaeon]|nr:BatD family protein [Candidatus Korarchaeota archaeon]
MGNLRAKVPAALIVLALLVSIPASTVVIPASAATKTYDWLDIELANKSEMMVGPFRIVAHVSAGVVNIYMLEVWKEQELCGVFQASNQQEEVQGVIKAYCREGGPAVFEVHLYGTESTTADGGKAKFDIKNSVYSPETKLRLHPVTPTQLVFNQTSTVVDLTVTVMNEGSGTPKWARLTTAYGRVEGTENATIELVATLPPVDNPTNFSIPPPKPREGANYTFEFSTSANGKAYAKLVATIGVSYSVDFKKDEQRSTSTHEVWIYDPGRVQSHTVRFYIVVGDIYRNVGVPEVRINLNHSSLTAQPGDQVSFEFTLKNAGTGDAFNVSIWLSVQPPLPQILVVSPEVPGLTGKPFTGTMTTPMLVPRLPKNAVTQRIKFKVIFPEDITIMGSYFNTTILVEWQDKVGKNFQAKLSKVIVVSEPELPSISINKQASPSEVSVKGTINVIVKVVNEGGAPATDVTVTDSFPEEYFELVQGKTSASVKSLAPGKSMTLSYKLKAKKEGSATLPAAEVQYKERDVPQLKYSNTLIIRIVKPAVGLELITSPPTRMIVGDLAEMVFSVSNDGSGQARDIELILEIPPGIDLLESEGPVTTQERTEEGGWKVTFRADSIDPGASVEFGMRMRVQRMGAYNISLINASFKGEAGEQKYKIQGAEALEFSFLVEVPRSQRIIVTAALIGMVGAVAAASFFAVRGIPSRYASRRPRLGLPR